MFAVSLALYVKRSTLCTLPSNTKSMVAVKSQVVQARVDPTLKKEATAILDEVGVSTSEAFTMFLRQVVMRKGLPFEAKVPNAETLAALREDTSTLKRYESVDDMFTDILGKDWRDA